MILATAVNEAWNVVLAVQLVLGVIAGIAVYAVRGTQKVVRLEQRFSGARRLLIGVALQCAGCANLFLVYVWARLPFLPLTFAGTALAVFLFFVGGQLVIWIPFGGMAKWSMKDGGDEDDEGMTATPESGDRPL